MLEDKDNVMKMRAAAYQNDGDALNMRGEKSDGWLWGLKSSKSESVLERVYILIGKKIKDRHNLPISATHDDNLTFIHAAILQVISEVWSAQSLQQGRIMYLGWISFHQVLCEKKRIVVSGLVLVQM